MSELYREGDVVLFKGKGPWGVTRDQEPGGKVAIRQMVVRLVNKDVKPETLERVKPAPKLDLAFLVANPPRGWSVKRGTPVLHDNGNTCNTIQFEFKPSGKVLHAQVTLLMETSNDTWDGTTAEWVNNSLLVRTKVTAHEQVADLLRKLAEIKTTT